MVWAFDFHELCVSGSILGLKLQHIGSVCCFSTLVLQPFFPSTNQKPKFIFHLLRFSLLCSLLNKWSNCAWLNLQRFQHSKVYCPKGPAKRIQQIAATSSNIVESSMLRSLAHHVARCWTKFDFRKTPSSTSPNISFVLRCEQLCYIPLAGPWHRNKTAIDAFQQQFKPTLSVLVFNMIFRIKL